VGAGAAATPTTTPAAAPAPTTAATAASATGAATTAARPAATASPVAASDGMIPGGAEGVPDAYLKPPPVFKAIPTVPGRGGKVSALTVSFSPPVPSVGENKYWQELNRRLGVTLDWVGVPTAGYQERMAALTAAGDLPELTHVHYSYSSDQIRVVQQGAYTDLTPYVTGDALKEFPNLAAFPPNAWRVGTVNKKVYGVPCVRVSLVNLLSYRKDWADKLGIGHPKSAEEFFRLMVGMTKDDPDGNGSADTFGIGEFRTLKLFKEMYRTPNGWRLNPDGTLTNEIETDEFRQAVAFVRRLVEAGVYFPDVAANSSQIRDGFRAGRIGAYIDGATSPYGRNGTIAALQKLNPAFAVGQIIPPGHDGGTGVTHQPAPGNGSSGFIAIPAQVGRDKERVKELLRILDYYAAPFGSEEWVAVRYGIEGVHHTVRPDGTRIGSDLLEKEQGDLTRLGNPPEVLYYPETPEHAVTAQNVIKDILALVVVDPTEGLISPTATAKRAELGQLQTDRLTAIYLGREPLGAFDTYVREWRSRGGDQIRRELEQALKEQP
jgi:putative aldouronate transport system substrate-binding protein